MRWSHSEARGLPPETAKEAPGLYLPAMSRGMTKCPGEGICMTIIIVICAEVVIMVSRVAARGGGAQPANVIELGYAGWRLRAGSGPSSREVKCAARAPASGDRKQTTP